MPMWGALGSVRSLPCPFDMGMKMTDPYRFFGGYGGGGRGRLYIIYLSLHCHHQNDFCIKMGSDESHFNVSVG